MELAFWIPLALIFGSALVAAIVKRYSKDPCLKVFHKSFVFVRLKDGRWISGYCWIYSNSIELRYHSPEYTASYQKLSYVLYEPNLDSIDRLLRPSPREDSPERKDWEREIARLKNPSFFRKLRRHFRNFFNMLRDAFSQAISVLFGAVKRRTRLGALPIDEGKVNEMGRTLMGAVPNAYEPILERYRGNPVVIETPRDNKVIEQIGVLQEYSAKYILARNVALLPELPPMQGHGQFDDQFDVAFPRNLHWIRHLARLT